MSPYVALGEGVVPLLPAPQGEAGLFPTHHRCITGSPAWGPAHGTGASSVEICQMSLLSKAGLCLPHDRWGDYSID